MVGQVGQGGLTHTHQLIQACPTYLCFRTGGTQTAK
jgi:hypothetical protein